MTQEKQQNDAIDAWDIMFKLAKKLGCLEMIDMNAYHQYTEGK